MKKLVLKNGEVLVDDEDFPLLQQYKWRTIKDGNCFYCVRNTSRTLGPQRQERLHRTIMNAKKGQIIDHIDGNGLNNQRKNLRYVTKQQNSLNRKPNKGRIYKGISWNKATNCWEVSIMLQGIKYHLGYFKKQSDAASAYDTKAQVLHKEFARLNFPLTK